MTAGEPEIVWQDGERCVVKRLPPRAAAMDTRHLALLEALRGAHHASLARVVDGGVRLGEERVRWIATRYVEGTPARDSIAHGVLIPSRVATVLQSIALGLKTLHGVGVIHRDVSPGNVILTLGGRAVLIDYGHAVLSGKPLPYSAGVVGTPGYVAPEVVVRGPAAVTPAVDVYGLGAVGYALLSGAAPSGGEDVLDTLADAAQMPPALQDMGIDCPAELELPLREALAPDPAQRPDAATLAAAFATLEGI